MIILKLELNSSLIELISGNLPHFLNEFSSHWFFNSEGRWTNNFLNELNSFLSSMLTILKEMNLFCFINSCDNIADFLTLLCYFFNPFLKHFKQIRVLFFCQDYTDSAGNITIFCLFDHFKHILKDLNVFRWIFNIFLRNCNNGVNLFEVFWNGLHEEVNLNFIKVLVMIIVWNFN